MLFYVCLTILGQFRKMIKEICTFLIIAVGLFQGVFLGMKMEQKFQSDLKKNRF